MMERALRNALVLLVRDSLRGLPLGEKCGLRREIPRLSLVPHLQEQELILLQEYLLWLVQL
jgi:hypothetical protein